MAAPPSKPVKPPAAKARLILEDPYSWEAAHAPTFRLSLELKPRTELVLDRETARQTWDALRLKPEEQMAQRAQLREANDKADAALKQAQTLRAQAVQLQTKLKEQQDTRWQHPAVYGAGTALLATGWLWLSERKNRLAAQQHIAVLRSEAHSVLHLPEGPSLSPYEPSPAPQPATTVEPADPSGSEIVVYDIDSELADMQAPGQEPGGADLVNLGRQSPADAGAVFVSEAMGDLLETRMATLALAELGQTQAAQNLLEQHINIQPQTCAWAYLAYLDLCTRTGQRSAFEAMRDRYRLQFNRLAPYWMDAPVAAQGLDSYESPMAQLGSAWPSPPQAKSLIATWLLGPPAARRMFQLPAYHDLLDLYEMLELYDELSPAAPPPMEPAVNGANFAHLFAVSNL